MLCHGASAPIVCLPACLIVMPTTQSHCADALSLYVQQRIVTSFHAVQLPNGFMQSLHLRCIAIANWSGTVRYCVHVHAWWRFVFSVPSNRSVIIGMPWVTVQIQTKYHSFCHTSLKHLPGFLACMPLPRSQKAKTSNRADLLHICPATGKYLYWLLQLLAVNSISIPAI